MAHIEWKDRYNINYKEIDEQHKGLVAILNRMIDLQGQEPAAQEVAEIFHRLCQYALTHFATEERYMGAAVYPNLERHKIEHATFIDQLLALNQAHDSGDPRLLDETLAFVKDWYLNHILQSDTDYAPFLKAYHTHAEIQGLLFSCSEVVCHLDRPRFLETLAARHGKTAADFQALAPEQAPLNLAQAKGLLDAPGFLAQASALCGCTLTETDFRQSLSGSSTPNEATGELLRQLKPRYRLALFADTTPWHFEEVIRALDSFPLFDAVTLSWEVGALRPDSALWDDALTKLGLMAEACVCIDDRAPFALAATGHLLHGLPYSTPEALLAGLRRLQVEV